MSKLRIAWVSPLGQPRSAEPTPGPSTGADTSFLQSARYSERVLPELAELCELECFVDDTDFGSTLAPEVPIYHYHRLFERSAEQPFDAYFHHIENDVRCQFARLSSHVFPGVSVFHDLALNDLYYGLFRYTTAPTELNTLVDAHFGSDAPRIGDYHVRGWSYEIFNRRYAFGAEEWKRSAHALVFYPAHYSALDAAQDFRSLAVAPQPASSPLAAVATSHAELLFTGEHLLADRARSVLSAFSRLSQRQELRLRWLLPSEEALSAARRCLLSFAREFGSAGLEQVHLEQLEAERLESALTTTAAFISMRTAALLAWPHGLVDALQTGVPVVSSSTQLAGLDFTAADGVFVVPEGLGDDLYLESFLSHLLQAARSRQPRVASLWASPKSCAQWLLEHVQAHQQTLAEENAKTRERIRSHAASRLQNKEKLTQLLFDDLVRSTSELHV